MNKTDDTIKTAIPEEQLLEKQNISNNFIFTKVLENPELCKGILERLLDIRIKCIEYPENSKIMRLAVYLDDGKNTLYYVVLQVTNSGTPNQLGPKAGYYQRAIDVEAIAQGVDYDELPGSFVIFISTFDVFGKGLWKYTFQNGCAKNGIFLEDDTSIIFFNSSGTKGDISKDAENILKFIESNTAEDDFTKELEQEVQKIKENKEFEEEYMALFDTETEK